MLWFLVAVIGIVLLIPVALYIPAVQDFAKNIACREVKKSTGMDIAIGRLRLKFPLDLSVDNVSVTEAGGDTMVVAERLEVDVALLPLLKGDIDVRNAILSNAVYRMGTPDSAMYLVARVGNLEVGTSSLNFMHGRINVDRAILDGGDVTLIMKDTVTAASTDTSASSPLLITARELQLRRVSYRMQMLPTIDSLGAYVAEARLLDGKVDMANKLIDARLLRVDSIEAVYLLPTPEYLSEHPALTDSATTANSPAGEMWTVTADSLRLTGRQATYAVRGAVPEPGLDMDYLQANDIYIAVDSFFNRGMQIAVPLKSLRATERCGINIDASGTFAIDSAAMHARDFSISTLFSDMAFNASMGIGDLASDPSLPLMLNADARISLSDVELALPTMKPITRDIPRSGDLRIKADINGSSGLLSVNDISAELPRLISLRANGEIAHPMDFDRMSGHVDIDGNLHNVNFIKPTLLEARMARQLNIPPMTLKGNIDYRPQNIGGSLLAIAPGGRIALDGQWNGRAESYDATLDANRFPVDAFMPSLGIGNVTATLSAKGKGYDPTKQSTDVDIKLDLAEIVYQGRPYTDTRIDANLHGGRAEGMILSHNPGLDLDAEFTASISSGNYSWDLDGDIRHLDLQAMKMSAGPMGGSLELKSSGTYSADSIDATVDITDLEWNMGNSRLSTDSIGLIFATTDSIVHASLTNADLTMLFDAYCPLDTFVARMATVSSLADTFMTTKSVDVVRLQHTLPSFDLSFKAGRNNIIGSYLSGSDMGFASADMILHNDSLIDLQAQVLGFYTKSMRLDTIRFNAMRHGKYLVYEANVGNRPGTMDAFAHVKLNGFVADDRLSVFMRQRNIDNKQGFFIGANASVADSVITLRFVPYKPTIGYKQWAINHDNFLSYDYINKHIDANLSLSNDKSYLRLFTEHTDTAGGPLRQEDIIVQASQIKLQDWLSISPFAPPIKGELGADLRFSLLKDGIAGNGTASLDNLYYGRDRVGSFGLDLNVSNSLSGTLHADIGLMVDSVKVMSATGVLNDSTAASPFLLDFKMIRFPLRVVNPFLPKNMARLGGMLNGEMDITGDMARPIFNGYLDFDSTTVKVGMLGSSFTFSEEKIPIDSNVVKFSNFAIRAANGNPLRVNGTVDLTNLTNAALDLTMKASDMQIVNSTRPRGADVYGKAFVDLDADIKGDMTFLDINADLDILPGTNVTYIMTNAESVISSQSTGDMVQFVNFADTVAVVSADSIAKSSLAMNLDAKLTISEGSTINVDLSTDGKNKVQLQSQGELNYNLNPMNDGRLTGRININKGFVRYSPPFMSEKLFNFEEGSYVAFNGDMMNPILNVHAVDELKANVTQAGQNSRLINFLISVSATNTLQNMNVKFDLSTNDDITIQNELTSMSPEQRANQAMNLLLYNVYTGPDTKATSNLSGNLLYSFLESQLNSWMANNVKGVDISFGIDQYDQTTDGSTSTTTSYSYKVSKTLFNDRFKIIVGGNYTTNAQADENFAQNLINDISFEYMLNRSGSMYVRIFRHVGYESILEGEITETGVGFVLKRKIQSLRDLFRFLPRRRDTEVPEPEASQSPVSDKKDEKDD